MKKYFTLTGTRYYLGKDFIHLGMKVHLYKEPENVYDKEAIRVECEGLGKIGYVANSVYTVIGDSLSAGRLYDRIGKHSKAEVIAVTDRGILCVVKKNKK